MRSSSWKVLAGPNQPQVRRPVGRAEKWEGEADGRGLPLQKQRRQSAVGPPLPLSASRLCRLDLRMRDVSMLTRATMPYVICHMCSLLYKAMSQPEYRHFLEAALVADKHDRRTSADPTRPYAGVCAAWCCPSCPSCIRRRAYYCYRQ